MHLKLYLLEFFSAFVKMHGKIVRRDYECQATGQGQNAELKTDHTVCC